MLSRSRPLAFLLLVIHPAYEFAADEVYRHDSGARNRQLLARSGAARGYRSHVARRAAPAGARQRPAAVASAVALVAALVGVLVCWRPC